MAHNFRYNNRLMMNRCRVMYRGWMVHRGMVYRMMYRGMVYRKMKGRVCLMTVYLVMLFMYSMMSSMI